MILTAKSQDYSLQGTERHMARLLLRHWRIPFSRLVARATSRSRIVERQYMLEARTRSAACQTPTPGLFHAKNQQFR